MKKCGGRNRLSDELVARMFADYERTGSLNQTAALHGRNLVSILGLFRARGLIVAGDPALKTRGLRSGGLKQRARLDVLVQQMHAEYLAGASLAELGRRSGRSHSSVRELFVVRGLPVRPCAPTPFDPITGRKLAAIPLTETQIEALIGKALKIAVPLELKLEWRKWPLTRRADFIARLRARLHSPDDAPLGPYSSNVEPFDYGSPRAWEILTEANRGLSSRFWKVKFDVKSQGVIFRDRLWFWSRKTGYQSGPWTPEHGRPVLHHLLWEEENGRPVPPASVIRFADGNPNNFTPSNLILVTRNALARENQASALFRKSRAMTALLLQRNQEKTTGHENTDTIQLLHSKRRRETSARANSKRPTAGRKIVA